jgi:hypothetical protein
MDPVPGRSTAEETGDTTIPWDNPIYQKIACIDPERVYPAASFRQPATFKAWKILH